MKTTAISCAIAASLALGSVSAQAQGWKDAAQNTVDNAPYEQNGQRRYADPQSRRQDRVERDERQFRAEQREGRNYRNAEEYRREWQRSRDFQASRNWNRDEWARHQQWRQAQGYQRYYRGDYVPYEYRQRHYYVNDWRARHLYAPPRGYQWVETDTGDYLLMALATGLIANLVLNSR